MINNVETWANVPSIIRRGAAWFSSLGTETSKGTKIFSLVGKINNTGLVEVPMGIRLRDIVFGIGGGIPEGREFKAVQIGGPSGGCIPKELLDLPIDYESLTQAGAMMGSGGMIVMDEDTCMVDIALYFLRFTQEESCGKCSPCRIGTRQMAEILARITAGEGSLEDLEKLEDARPDGQAGAPSAAWGRRRPIPSCPRCAISGTSTWPTSSDRVCPARVCKNLITFFIDPEKCVGCLLCLKNCPVERHLRGAEEGPRHRPGRLHQVRGLSQRLPGQGPGRDRNTREEGPGLAGGTAAPKDA